MLFRFKLGSIPVEVHGSYLLISGLIAYSWAPQSGNLGQSVAIWMGIIFVSVLFHELGHATVSLLFGWQPAIQLAGFGGNTRPNAKGPIPWWKDLLLTAGGPAFGFVLFGASTVALGFTPHNSLLRFALGGAAIANLFWSVANLLPIPPLDGGRISTVLLMRGFGRRGFLFAQVIALIVGGGLIAWRALMGDLYNALFISFFAFRAIPNIQAYFRGQGPIASSDPRERAFAEALAKYRAGELPAARQAVQPLLDQDLPPQLRARIHHLLGWISLKDGKGRDALDHFAQVQGQPVEPHALAAGFSLVGDESRALPLWEDAFRATGDRTVLHEWAGTLLRMGRTDDAKRLPGVELPAAYSCAERVLFLRGDFAGAARIGLEALAVDPRPERAYDAACALARDGKLDEAVRLLQRAAELGFRDADYAASDPDLSALNTHPGFHSWLASVRNTRR